jgi:D-glycero-beta-D-manno-heptose 1-phosphate adenylyltransferase
MAALTNQLSKTKDKEKAFKNRHKKLLRFKDLQRLSKKLKSGGNKIVFTVGSFDILNPGHCRYLADAKAAGDILVVGISSDAADNRIKGSCYPLIPEEVRAELVSYLRSVDYVTVVDSDRPHASLIMLQPDIFFTSIHDWDSGLRGEQDQAVLETYGGKIIKEPRYEPYFSVEDLVEHIASIRVVQILESYLSEKVSGFKLDPEKHLQPADFEDQIPVNKSAYDANDFILDLGSFEEFSADDQSQDIKTLVVSGSYDLLHVGHARFIEQAALLADRVVVAIPSDRAVRRLKGVGRPVMSERSRAYVLAHLDPVDNVVIFPETDVLETLTKIKPDVFYTVQDSWNDGYKDSPEYRLVTSYGGKVVCGEKQSSHISASAIIDKVAQEKVREIFKECVDEERYSQILKERSRLNGHA